MSTVKSTRDRTIAWAVGTPALLASLAACSLASGSQATATIDSSANPAGVSSSAEAGSGASATGAAGGTGCRTGEAQVPRGVSSVKTADLDGDGTPDRLWLYDNKNADDLKRYVGVAFSAGGGTSTTFESADPQTATAVAGRMHDGAAMVLLDTGRSVHLYTVVDCRIVSTENKQGRQYTFDKGFTGYSTGVGCPVIGAEGRQLVGYLAAPAKGDVGGRFYRVTRTTIDLSGQGRVATNSTTVTLGSRLGADSSEVRTAFQVACGSSGQAKEGGY